ncbi:male sterility protein-domain-containing protein [Lentinula aciculospora]|uniref:Male sterility protein-domain-containing protein n=1 Tax=Lentinula aciculospora TaxID=153920 RepID=A0A9W9DT66_9AGAR|nr:male sterility protein-domain-containing protein [Lentinula aciculospora]
MLYRLQSQFESRKLDLSLLFSQKLVFLEGDISLPNSGLSKTVINELQQELTAIIHNAWKSNFSLPLATFEFHIKGTRTLIDLACSSKHRSDLRFVFISSITITQNWDESQGPYLEKLVMDAFTAAGGGYGECRYVTERILAKSGLEAMYLRVGQICGGEPSGVWKSSEWIPMIVKRCLSLGAFFIPTSTYEIH